MHDHLDISARIEALLFFKGEAVTIDFLAKTLKISEDEVQSGLGALEQALAGRGIVLLRNGDEVMLGTAPQMGATIEGLLKEELNNEKNE